MDKLTIATKLARARERAIKAISQGKVTDAVWAIQNHAIKLAMEWERAKMERVRKELHPTKEELMADVRRLFPRRK